MRDASAHSSVTMFVIIRTRWLYSLTTSAADSLLSFIIESTIDQLSWGMSFFIVKSQEGKHTKEMCNIEP